MRADQRALVALDAVLFDPAGNKGSYAAFFILRTARGEGTVLAAAEGRDRQIVTAVGGHRPQHFADESAFILALVSIISSSGPLSGNSYCLLYTSGYCSRRVAPFGDLRIKACLRLPEAFRS